MGHFFLIWFLLMLFPISAGADYFRYTDKNGIVHYTDDFGKIPEEYRTEVNGYERQNGNQKTVKEPPAKTNLQTDALIPFQRSPQKKTTPENRELKRKALLKKKKAIEKEYRALIKEKEQLSASIEELTKRSKIRKRKSAARANRAKFKQLKDLKSKWKEKYRVWEAKKKALDEELQAHPPNK